MFQCHPEWFRAGGLLVHVAPEAELMKQLSAIARSGGMTYRCGGITGQGEFYLDLLNLPFRNDSVDLLYCCHVLNMVPDDVAGMREVFRVMSPCGVALLQVPAFHQGTASVESRSAEESMSLFHDPLMYRCYSDPDYVARLQSVGFHVRHLLASELPQELVRKHQLKNEVLHACFKQDPASAKTCGL